MCVRIYSCKGKHFKVYNSELQEVLEHPKGKKPFSVNFGYDEHNLIITVTDFIKTKMRIRNQKNRGDIYILQNQFKPLLRHLKDTLKRLEIESKQEKPWRFGSPRARGSRQGVPKFKKLAEISDVSLIAPFKDRVFEIKNGYLVVDSEIPGRNQTTWQSEGGERQIHLGVFGSDSFLKKKEIPEEVIIEIPLEELENNFLKPITNRWIDLVKMHTER